MEHRRVERLPVGRGGLCRVGTDPEEEWLHCRLLDISMRGLAIYLQHPSPSALIGQHVIVEVSPFDDSVLFRLEGSISEALPMKGSIRVAIAFGKVSAPERYMIDVLTWTQVDVKTA
jgi:hypothetical protein